MNILSEADAHDYLGRAFKVFFEGGMHGEPDHLKATDEAVGYLFMAVDGLKDPEIQALAYGFLASCLELLGERERCKEWVDKALKIDPDNVFANITNYDLKVEKYAKSLDGLQKVMNLHPLTSLATSITFALGPQKTEIKKYALGVYKAYNNTISKEPDGLSVVYWIFGAKACLGIADQLRKTGINEPFVCRVIFNIPWEKLDKFQTSEEKATSDQDIQYINVQANKLLRLMPNSQFWVCPYCNSSNPMQNKSCGNKHCSTNKEKM